MESIGALITFATATLTYLAKREENNPRWLKELKALQAMQRKWNEEYDKGDGNRNLYKLDRIERELYEFQKPLTEYLLASAGKQ